MTFADLKKGDKVVFSGNFQENMVFVCFETTDWGTNAILVNEELELVYIASKTQICNERYFTFEDFEKLCK
jgi:ketosteroid isomerase-like protein